MRSFLTVLLTAVVFFPLNANATDVEGDVWGTWTRENSPYNVIGEVRVPPGSTLVIEPGVLVDFKGHYKFIVDSLAVFLAIGTETDSIVFTAEDPDSGWHGIRFLHSDGSCRVRYCRIEYGRAAGGLSDKNGGAIFCEFADPIISNNSIAENSAHWGGGICCSRSSAVICNNVFIDNRADSAGGGVACSQSSPRINANLFERNIADSSGGGIFCWRCSTMTVDYNSFYEDSAYRGGGINCFRCLDVSISDNVVHRNRAGRGAGIQCNFSDRVTIANNLVSENRSRWSGAGIRLQRVPTGTVEKNFISGNRGYEPHGSEGSGIYLKYSSPLIQSNTICGNSSEHNGGGIYCGFSSPVIVDNTITANSAVRGGGVFSCRTSHPELVNNILWADTAETGPEICLFVMDSYPCTLTVAYCDVQGGESGVHVGPECILYWGQGNMAADPVFVGPERHDFNLRWRSPCIDTGLPDSLDPDGTRSDIGAFYFDQSVPGIVELYPHDTPIVIPSQGGELSFDGWVFNFSGQRGRVDIWTYVSAPEIGRYGPLDLWNVRIPTDSLGLTEISRRIPEVAPEGDYVFVACVGQYPSSIVDSSYFYFTKGGEIEGVPRDWTENSLPLDYALFQNYPNPFNATTRINYQLPVNAHVKLEVYNLLGQKVATLLDSKQQAGFRSITWDASGFSSGLYFYRLTAGEFSQTKRMMLVK